MSKLLALAGCGCLAIVALTHLAEHWRLLQSMGWGLPNSAGHYLDLASAIAGPALPHRAFFVSKFQTEALGIGRSAIRRGSSSAGAGPPTGSAAENEAKGITEKACVAQSSDLDSHEEAES